MERATHEFPLPPRGLMRDDEIEVDESEARIAGWIVLRPVDTFRREFFDALRGRWYERRARWEKDGVLRMHVPQATTLYETEEEARRAVTDADATGTATVAAVPARSTEHELLAADREDRRVRRY